MWYRLFGDCYAVFLKLFIIKKNNKLGYLILSCIKYKLFHVFQYKYQYSVKLVCFRAIFYLSLEIRRFYNTCRFAKPVFFVFKQNRIIRSTNIYLDVLDQNNLGDFLVCPNSPKVHHDVLLNKLTIQANAYLKSERGNEI